MSKHGIDGDGIPGCSRRDLLVRGAQVTAGASALAALLAACGGEGAGATTAPSSSAAATAAETTNASGPLRLLTFPGPWIGTSTAADFYLAHEVPLDVSEYPGNGKPEDMVEAVTAQSDGYDVVWVGQEGLRRLQDAGLAAEVDEARVPNLGLVTDVFRQALPGAAPTDWGSLGFAYRGDLVSERPTTWTELWELAQKAYSGKLAVADDDFVVRAALIKDGVAVIAADQAQINAARDAVIALKPHMIADAPISADPTKPLVDGTAALAIAGDAAVGWARYQNPDVEIVWVAPEEGLPAFTAGLVALAGTPRTAEADLFINFVLDPPNYAAFINTMATAWVMPEVNTLVDKSFLGSPLDWNEKVIKRADFGGGDLEQNARLMAAWDEVKAV